MLVTVTLNPSVDRTVFLHDFVLHGTNRVERTETDAGGKGINVARIADKLGCRSVALGFAAGGPGEFIRHTLAREGVEHDFVQVPGETRLNFSIENESGHPPTTLNERGPAISSTAWDELVAKLRHWAETAEWVAIGGSIPPNLPSDCYKQLIEIAKLARAQVCLDADGEALRCGLLALPDLVKPNREEMQRLLGRPIPNLQEALEASKLLSNQGVRYPIISMGEHGAALFCQGVGLLARPPKIVPRSTIGSGDSLIGAFLAKLIEGASTQEALRWGIAAGAATALSDGASIGSLQDIESLVGQVGIEARG